MNQTEKTGTNKSFYFFDTYALFEVIRGNPKYEPYLDAQMAINIFNLAEFNYNLKKEYSKEKADAVTAKYKSRIVKIAWNDIINAMDLKSKYRHLSIPHAVGYSVAKRLNIKFLTGDDDFKDFENVEFVKK